MLPSRPITVVVVCVAIYVLVQARAVASTKTHCDHVLSMVSEYSRDLHT